MRIEEVLYVGVKQTVLALDRSTGESIWETVLPGESWGSAFVNVLVDEGRVYAHANGKVFCLDATDGRILWENPLDGFGYGIATLATVHAPGGDFGSILEEIQEAHRRSAQ